jgi:hypothetical protein
VSIYSLTITVKRDSQKKEVVAFTSVKKWTKLVFRTFPTRWAFVGCQRASVVVSDVVCELANILPAAADGADPVPFAAQSIFANSGKLTPIWQTYFR